MIVFWYDCLCEGNVIFSVERHHRILMESVGISSTPCYAVLTAEVSANLKPCFVITEWHVCDVAEVIKSL